MYSVLWLDRIYVDESSAGSATFLEVGLVKVPGDDEGSVRMLVVISAELVVEFGQSQDSVCLW